MWSTKQLKMLSQNKQAVKITILDSSLLRSTCATTNTLLIQACLKKAPIYQLKKFGTVPNPAAAGSTDKPLFNLILPIVAIALSSNLCSLSMVCRSSPGSSSSWQSSQLRWQLFLVFTALKLKQEIAQSSPNRCCWSHALCFPVVVWFPNLSKR